MHLGCRRMGGWKGERERVRADWPAATATASLCVPQFGNTALMVASNQGDFLKVKNLCEQKADVNKQDKVRQTDQGAAGHGFLQRWSQPGAADSES